MTWTLMMTLVIIMGVSGSGKTTVGTQLAQQQGWQFKDADTFHSLKNRFKMQQGQALTDQDRSRWLRSLNRAIATWHTSGQSTVLACSALKSQYRQQLVPVHITASWVYLKGTYEQIQQRLEARQQASTHFMHPALLKSQFDTLEEPDNALSISITEPPTEIVTQIESYLNVTQP